MTKGKILSISLLLSIVAEIFLILIIYYNPFKISAIYDTDLQSWVSALMNGLSAVALGIAVYFIKQKNKTNHIIFIHFALLFSALFLVNYIFYHLSIGHVKFENTEYRTFYLIVLGSHLLTSIITLPMIFTSYALGLYNMLIDHKKLAKWTFILWEYVSITGVMIVLMLKFLNT